MLFLNAPMPFWRVSSPVAGATAAIDWTQSLAARWQREGRSGFLLPLEVSLDMRLSDLIGVDRQVEQLGRNTQQFLDGMPANHALLWGSRGTGKSSLVRACWPSTPRRACA
jgi:predicted AAA+ superfamily ATPase